MKNIVFIGDSITDIGDFPAIVEAFVLSNNIKEYDFINLGVSSENVSGVTEKGHPFKRPNALSRIDRITEVIEGEWATVMYGENDGIYRPFSEENFALYKKGITEITEKLKKAGFKVALITPTPFDPISYKGKLSESENCPDGTVYVEYNSVMTAYADWIRECGLGDKVIDVNRAVSNYLAERRKDNPVFKTGDGIHQGKEGDYIIATEVLRELFAIDIGSPFETPLPKVYKTARKKSRVTHRFFKEFIGHESPYKERKISQSKFISKKIKYTKSIAKMI